MHNNLASVTWHNTQWIPLLNASNVIEYFMDLSNPFYDKTCNNEIMKMQRLSLDQLSNMSGPEYILLHAQEPILYVIRKQHRHSPTQVTPLADYYIAAGTVYQAPDLGAVINSRILTAVSHLESSFNEAHSFSRYQPSKGYSWEFKEKSAEKEKVRKKAKPEEESTSLQFMRTRVDYLLTDWSRKFQAKPPPVPQPEQAKPAEKGENKNEIKVEVKQEKSDNEVVGDAQAIKPPPEKRQRLG